MFMADPLPHAQGKHILLCRPQLAKRGEHVCAVPLNVRVVAGMTSRVVVHRRWRQLGQQAPVPPQGASPVSDRVVGDGEQPGKHGFVHGEYHLVAAAPRFEEHDRGERLCLASTVDLGVDMAVDPVGMPVEQFAERGRVRVLRASPKLGIRRRDAVSVVAHAPL